MPHAGETSPNGTIRPIPLKNSFRAFRAEILKVFKPSTGSFASL
jgi:hypothetical protein